MACILISSIYSYIYLIKIIVFNLSLFSSCCDVVGRGGAPALLFFHLALAVFREHPLVANCFVTDGSFHFQLPMGVGSSYKHTFISQPVSEMSQEKESSIQVFSEKYVVP